MTAIEGLASSQRSHRGLLLVLSLSLAVAAFGILSVIVGHDGARGAFQSVVQSPFGLLALLVVSALSTATVFLPAPGMALTFFAGMGGEPLLVGLVAGVGQGVGELTGYLAGLAGAATLAEQPRFARPLAWLRRFGAPLIALMAFLPNPFFDAAGLAAGAIGMRLRVFLAAVILGRAAKNLLLAHAGDGWLQLIVGLSPPVA
jgi:membrane protein YqaA with SNARE-associated domain